MCTEEFEKVKKLVGNIKEKDLKCVDYYAVENFGIFIPSTGYCKYSIKRGHTHPSYSFVISFSKDNMVFTPDIELKENMCYCTAISPEFPHEEEIKNRFTRYIAIFISKKYYEDIYLKYSNEIPKIYDIKHVLVSNEIMTYINGFIKEFELSVKYNDMVLESLGNIITNMIIRSILKLYGDVKLDDFTANKEIEKALEHIHQNFHKKILNSDLSKIAGMSESHFSRIFRSTLNVSPIEYLIKVRIEKSKKLLKSSKNITEVSLECGFNSNSHFSTSFLEYNGVTPSEYRKSFL